MCTRAAIVFSLVWQGTESSSVVFTIFKLCVQKGVCTTNQCRVAIIMISDNNDIRNFSPVVIEICIHDAMCVNYKLKFSKYFQRISNKDVHAHTQQHYGSKSLQLREMDRVGKASKRKSKTNWALRLCINKHAPPKHVLVVGSELTKTPSLLKCFLL